MEHATEIIKHKKNVCYVLHATCYMLDDMFGKRRVYMDYAAATPVHPEVARAVAAATKEFFGNPSAPHLEGRLARSAIDEARGKIAQSFSVKPEELVFTSGGTEANNIAIQGLVQGLRNRGAKFSDLHIVTSAMEHSSVLETVALLEKEGVLATYLASDSDGRIRPEAVASALRPETVLVTLAHVNGETGVIQPISEIARAIRSNTTVNCSKILLRIAPEARFPIFHVDAAQSPLYLDSSPHTLSADLVSYDAQKILGPKGVGVLYRDFSVPLAAVSGGGSQERNIRPGTENTPAIVGAGVAFELAKEGRAAREAGVKKIQDHLIELAEKAVPEAELIGSRKHRIANNALFAISGIDGDYLAVLMDKEGVAVTPRSACAGSGGAISDVVLAITGDSAKAKGTIRFSLGPEHTRSDCERAVLALQKCLTILK